MYVQAYSSSLCRFRGVASPANLQDLPQFNRLRLREVSPFDPLQSDSGTDCEEDSSDPDSTIHRFLPALGAISSRLTALNLSSSGFDIQAAQLFSATQWPALRKLKLNFNFITNSGLILLMFMDWPRLQTLELARNGLTTDACRSIGRARLPSLRVLNLSQNWIKNQGLFILLGQDLRLKKLALNDCALGPGCGRALSGLGISLQLRDNDLGTQDLQQLSKSHSSGPVSNQLPYCAS